MVEIILQRSVVEGGQQNAAHGRAICRQAPTHRQVNRDQTLGGGGTGDIKNVIAFQGGHVAGFMQLLAHAVQVRLGRNSQRCGRQIGMTEGQYLGQQRVGAPIRGGVAELDQGVQATAHGGAGNFGAVADLGDGQVTLALLERLHHGQATGQGRHEIRITGECLDALGR